MVLYIFDRSRVEPRDRSFFMSIRIGFGIDFHQLAEGRAFWLGGVEIPSTRGAVGHSDADVLLHAICDALLGALALGDIGQPGPAGGDPSFGEGSERGGPWRSRPDEALPKAKH